MQKRLALTVALIYLAVISPLAHAGFFDSKKDKKDPLVLMPLRVIGGDASLRGTMETALVEGLQQKYEVFSGEQVSKKAKEIFLKESQTRTAAKKECDETRCMQDIAMAFQAELIATSSVTKITEGYVVALTIQNILDNKVVYSKTLPCKHCDSFEVIEKLKELSGAPAAAPNKPPTQATAPKESSNSNAEKDLWQEVQKGNSADDYRVYLKKYPNGNYATLAESRVSKLTPAKKDESTQADPSLWGKAAGLVKSTPSPEAAAGTLQKKAATAPVEAPKAQPPAYKGPAMVRIPGKKYEMGKYEVTQKEWRDVMGSNPSSFKECGDTCPVTEVSWNDIQGYLNKLNAKSGRQYRLPTEAEWEYACYGGSKTEYCGGNDIDSVAWYAAGWTRGDSHPVGQKKANGYGLYDMSGNVWEWQGDCCVLRGGSYRLPTTHARVAFRFEWGPAKSDDDAGFRLARTLP